MKKVLFVATVVKTHIMPFHIPFLKQLKEMGYETAVAARNDYENPDECSIPYCDEYFDVRFERFPFDFRNIKAYKKLKEIISNGRYDIIHCHTPVGGVLARICARKMRKDGTKVIYTAHGFHFFKNGPLINWILFYPVEKILSKVTDVLITINREDYDIASKKFYAGKTIKIPGIGVKIRKYNSENIDREEIRKAYGISEKDVVVLSTGELTKRKNHSIIIKAIAKLNNTDIRYLIAGDGAERRNLECLVDRLNLKNQVMLLGYTRNIPDLCRAADMFAFPSKREGLGLAAIEAMAAGLPIITSNVNGINDYSVDGVTGYKCDPNDVDAYARCIDKLVKNPKLRKEMGEYNVNAADKYDLENVLPIMYEVYNATL